MSIHLLIVDDSPISRKLVQRSLPEDLAFRIDEAADGQEAVDAYRELKPTLVLMDLIMPVMTGLDAIVEIMTRDPEARIIALTSDIQETTRQRLLAAGARDVLHKPVRADDLERAIREHVGA